MKIKKSMIKKDKNKRQIIGNHEITRDKKISKQQVGLQILFIPNSIEMMGIPELVLRVKEEIDQQVKRMENQE